MIKEKLLMLPLLLIIFLSLSFFVSADTIIENISVSPYVIRSYNELLTFGDQSAISTYYTDNNYYVSYLDENKLDGTSHWANWIATSLDDGATWNRTQHNHFASGQNNCFFFLDIDFDLICLRYSGHSGTTTTYRYFIKEAEQDYFLSDGDRNIALTNSVSWEKGRYNYIHNRNSYLWIHTMYDDGSVDYETTRNFGQLDIDVSGYTIDFSGTSTGRFEGRVPDYSWLEFEDNVEEGSGFYDRHEFTSNTTNLVWKFFDFEGVNETTITTWFNFTYINPQFLWGYADWNANQVSIFFIQNSTGDLLHLSFIDSTIVNETATDVGLNSTIERDDGSPRLKMIEGSSYIWGIYITTGGDIRRFRIDKNTFLLDQDEIIVDSGQVSVISNIVGQQKSQGQSSSVLITDAFSFAYVNKTAYPRQLVWFTDDVFDKYEAQQSDPTLACNDNYDCWAKFDTSYTCVEGVCTIVGAGAVDINYTEGDLLYDWTQTLGSWGIQSTSSKLFFAIVGLIVINIIAGFIMMAVSNGHPNLILNAVITLLGLFLFAYLGWIPLWVVVLLIILTAGVIALFFRNGGT